MNDSYFSQMDLNKSLSEDDMKQILDGYEYQFPSDYLSFMKNSNGAEGFVGTDSYLALWSLQEVVELNGDYNVKKFAPGLVLIGTDGGGTGYGYDMRDEPKSIVEVPLIGMSLNELSKIADSFENFIKYLYELKE